MQQNPGETIHALGMVIARLEIEKSMLAHDLDASRARSSFLEQGLRQKGFRHSEPGESPFPLIVPIDEVEGEQPPPTES